MRTLDSMQIDVNETFGRLKNPPIVEAIIEFRGQAQRPWEEDTVKREFENRLVETDYAYLDSLREYGQEIKLSSTAPDAPEGNVHYLGWKGLRFKSADGVRIVQFNRNGFVFSWLEPYESWEQFRDNAMTLWRVYQAVAAMDSIDRVGVRFINRIVVDGNGKQASDYVRVWPASPDGLPVRPISFLHVDEFDVPGHTYGLRITSTIQQDSIGHGQSVILDIDVFTTKSPRSTDEALMDHLQKMRWLKNKAFLGSITGEALRKMEGDQKCQ